MSSDLEHMLFAQATVWARRIVEDIVRDNPTATAADILAVLRTREAEAVGRLPEMEDSTCRFCGQAIIRQGGAWYHVAGMRRGCRAASFDRLDDWDDQLERHWKAAPAK